MNPLLDPLMDTTDGGSPPRRRLAESMIAGRRRPSTSRDADSKEEEPARGRRRTTRSQPATPPEDETPKPATTRRRRRPATRRVEEAPEPEPVATDEPEAPEAESKDEPEAAAVPPVAAPQRSAVEAIAAIPEVEPAPEATAPPAAPEDLRGLAGEVGQLRSLIEQQRTVLAEVRAGLLTLAQEVDRSGYRPRLGVFVDVPNLMYGIESDREVHMGRLLDLLREGRQLIRATAYSPVSDDPREPIEQQKFVAPFVPYDYRIVTKPLKRFADGSIKGNFDVEMAIDMLSMADRVDVVAIVSGDADFARAVEAVQSRGVRVEVIAFAGSTSLEMRALADHYLELSSVLDRIT